MNSRTADSAAPNSGVPRALTGRVRTTLAMIQFEHSVFALPFALTGALLAARGWPGWRVVFWIIVAMVGARSAAMTFNRLADLRFDSLNPRTRHRALPAGHLSRRFAAGFTVVSCAVLVIAARELNPLAFRLSPLLIGLILGYSYTKRFTWLSHLAIGLCLGLSPVAAAIAVRGSVSPAILLLGAAVTLWVAGFDLIYACQDAEFDRSHGLRSVPQRFGIRAALWASGLLHLAMLATLVGVARLERLGWPAFAGLALVTALLAWEHRIVGPNDLSRVNAAFFTLNGYVSVVFFMTWAMAILGR